MATLSDSLLIFTVTEYFKDSQILFFWREIGHSSDDYLKPLRGPLKSGDYELSVDFELNAREERKHMTHKDLHMTSVDLKSILGVKRYTVEDKIAFTMKDKIEEARNAVVNKAELEKKKYNTNEIRCLLFFYSQIDKGGFLCGNYMFILYCQVHNFSFSFR